MPAVIGVILGVLIPSLWIFLPRRKLSAEKRLKTSTYIKSIIIGMTVTTIAIIVVELTFSKVTGYDPGEECKSLAQGFVGAFAYAALIEETIKLFFVRRVIRKYKPQDKLQYMLLAGTIGMGYGIMEKIALGPSMGMIISALFAMHILFQFVMGACLFEADQARMRGDGSYKSYCARAFLLPYAMHGFWDAILMCGEVYLNSANVSAAITAVIAMLFSVVLAAVFEIRVIRRIVKMQV